MLLLIGALASPQARAQVSWVLDGTGNFNDGENWSSGSVPVSEPIIIDNGGTAQSSAANAVGSVSLGGGSTLAIMPGDESSFDSDDFYAGTSGTGTLTIGSQALMNTRDFYAGYGADATGNVNVDGAYLSPDATYIGYAGNATFVLQNGSTLQSTTGSVGTLAGSHGILQLTDSTWKAVQQSTPVAITVGGQGTGEVQASGTSLILALSLTIGDGAAVTAESSQIGLNAGSSGEVTLDDALWTTTNTLTIGSAGNGEFNASNGSVITATMIELAAGNGITGSLAVTNSWVVTQTINAGNADGASMEFDGAQVNLLGGWSVTDTLLIEGFNAGSVVIAGGGLTVDTLGGNAQIPSPLSGPGALTKTGEGRLRLTASNTFSGGVFV